MNNDMNDKLFELYTLAELKYKKSILIMLMIIFYFLVVGMVIRIIKRK